MVQSRTQTEFAAYMERQGYQVKWKPHHKYITYTTPEGQRCRDNRLHEDKYLKTNMEEHYAQLGRAQEPQRTIGATDHNRALSPAGQRHSDRAMEHHAPRQAGDGQPLAGAGTLCGQSANHQGGRGHDGGLLLGGLSETEQQSGRDYPIGAYGHEVGFVGADDYDNDDIQATNTSDRDGGYTPSPRYVGTETQTQMDGHRGVNLNSVLYLAKTVEDLVNPYDPEQEKKKVKPQPQRKRRKRQRHDHEQEYDFCL